MLFGPRTYMGCTIERRGSRGTARKGEPGRYFGLDASREARRNGGYQRRWVLVTFPNGTWIECANMTAAKRYIRGYLAEHPGASTRTVTP